MNLLALDKIIAERERMCHRLFRKWLTSTPPIVARGYREVMEDDKITIIRYLDEWWSRVKRGDVNDNI